MSREAKYDLVEDIYVPVFELKHIGVNYRKINIVITTSWTRSIFVNKVSLID